MMESLTSNTKAILLLTAPLAAKRNGESAEILKPSEYRKLAIRLREMGAQPADLLASETDQLLAKCRGTLEVARLRRLLGRGFLLSQAYERWQARAIWVVSRADDGYPQRLKSRLRDDSPPVLYGCGELAILESGGLAVVGSREAHQSVLEFARDVGALAASAGRAVVSGGARGVDQAAMRGALESGGRAVGVLADSLERTAMNREHRNLLLDGKLVVVSPYDPGAGFNVGHAMQRNKLIYALADAAVVASAEFEKGGTWAGAIEELEKLRLVPVFVWSPGATSHAMTALLKKGARPWPDPRTAEDLDVLFAGGPSQRPSEAGQPELPLTRQPVAEPGEAVREAPMVESVPRAASDLAAKHLAVDPADELLVVVRTLMIRLLAKPLPSADIAIRLGVSKPQADAWLKLLVAEGMLEKKSKPVRYGVKQVDLFGGAPART